MFFQLFWVGTQMHFKHMFFLTFFFGKFSTLSVVGGGDGSDPSVEFSSLFFLTGSPTNELNISIVNIQYYITGVFYLTLTHSKMKMLQCRCCRWWCRTRGKSGSASTNHRLVFRLWTNQRPVFTFMSTSLQVLVMAQLLHQAGHDVLPAPDLRLRACRGAGTGHYLVTS